MASYNRIFLLGNVGQDPKTVTFQDGSQMATFTLAVSERFTDRSGQQQERTEWFNIKADGKSAATVAGYVRKGTQLFVEGKLQTRRYTDQQGQERSVTEVRCLNFQLVGARPQQPAVETPARPSMPMPMPVASGVSGFNSEDIPF